MPRRRRLLAASALLAIGAALVVAPLVVAPAFADSGLELTSPFGSASYSGAEYTFSGTADPSDASAIVIRDGEGPSDPVLCTTAAASTWSCDGDWVPTAGTHTLTAWQDTRHDTVTLTLTVPAPLVDDLTITIIEGGTVHISGTTTAPNSDIVITIAGSDYCGGGSSYPDGFAWWCDLGGWAGTGTFPIAVRQVVNGVDSPPVTGGTLTVLAAGFHLTSPASGDQLVWIADPTFTPAGMTDDLVTPIDVSIDGTVPGVCDDILPASDGSWSCSVTYPRPNEPATHAIIATQGANSASVSFDVIYPRPDWIGGSVVSTEQGATVTTFSGYAGYDDGGPINESIHVGILSTGLSCNSTISVVNTWSCDIDTSSLAVNSYAVEVYESYGAIAGQILDGTLDVLTAGSTDPVTLTAPAGGATISGSAVFTGMGPIGGSVDVLAQRTGTAIPVQTMCSATVASDGSWTCSAPATMWGLWDVQAEATDLLSGVTTTPLQALTIAGYPKPTLSYGGPTNGIYAHGISANGGDVSIWLYQVDTSNPTQYTWVGPVDNCPLAVPIETECTLNGGAPLAPGIWNVYAEDVWMNVSSPGESVMSTLDAYFYVPATPTMSPTLNADRTISFAVTRETGSTVTITDVATSAVACTVSGPGTGGTCSTTPTAGSHQYSARAASVGFASNTGTPRVADNDYDWFSETVTSMPIVVPAAPSAPAPNPAPSPTKTPWTWSFSSDGDGVYQPGDRVSFRGEGVPAGSEILFELHSTVRSLGTTTAAQDGTFSFTATIPDDVEAGAHHFVLTATPPGDTSSVLEEPVEIQLPLVEVEDEPEAEPDLAAAGTEGGGSGGGSGTRSEPAAPSILSNSLATFGHIVEDPFVLVLAGGLTIALLFLVAVPTELLNSTLSANTGRLGRVFVAVDDRLERLKSWFIRVTRSRALASGILVLVLSLIYGFTDPDFGFDLVSLRLVLSLAIGMFILTYLIGWVTGLLSRATWGVYSQVDLRPSIAIFAVVGVIAARILEFSPGFFVGVVIGLELLQASQRVASRVALLQFSLVVGVSVGAWLWYSALITGGPPTDFGGALLGDTLVALTAEGLTAAVIAILPLRFLEGRELYKESKALWLGAFLVIAFAFALLVLPTAMRGTEVGDVGVWVIVFAIFAVVTFALWATFATIDRRREAAEERNTAQHDRVHG